MTKELKDPNPPPGAVIAVDDKTGIATRNDGGKLQPAAKNPWYVLATIAGEQPGKGIDHTLHEKNRRYWNGWACTGMDDETRAALAKKMDLPPEDLAPLSKNEKAEVRTAFNERLGRGAEIPANAETIDFQKTHFPAPLGMEKCALAQRAFFSSTTFSATANFDFAVFRDYTYFEAAQFVGASTFKSADFYETWFTHAVFDENASFKDANFQRDATFSGVTFNGTAVFNDARFGQRAFFAYAVFEKEASFANVKVRSDLNCAGTTFKGSVVFTPLNVGSEAVFTDTDFHRRADFSGAEFEYGTSFRNATFCGFVNFQAARLSGESGHADFISAAFISLANFTSATFSAGADFTSATFDAEANFTSATFSGRADFSRLANFTSTTFGAEANFTSATFSAGAAFGANFGAAALFRSAKFSIEADFASANFYGIAEFSDGDFAGKTSFRDARFRGEEDGVPTFYGRSFHQDTEFTIKRECWPDITHDNAEHSKRAYTRLRQIMNELFMSDAEAFFNRQELWCNTERAKGLHKLVGRGYDLVSEYGYSITRPLWGLAVVVGLCWGILGSQMTGDLGPETAPAIARGLGLSISNTFAFFGFQRLYFDTAEIRAMPGWTHWLGAAQTVLGFILVFLLGLGLRNRFRLK